MAVRKTHTPKMIPEENLVINPIINEEEFFDKGRMFARIVMEKGGVVKWHEHQGEIEYYYILSGTGIFTNSDKSEQSVEAGDVCTMDLGGGHAIRQTGEAPLEFVALIFNV